MSLTVQCPCRRPFRPHVISFRHLTAMSRWQPTWLQRTVAIAAGVLVVYVNWQTGSLSARVVRDVTLFLVIPLALGLTHRRRLGWRVDRQSLRDTALLAILVLPFYLVGASLPSIRAFYPLWSTEPVLGAFLPHAVQLFVLALATETYFRGLLCVGLREIGFKCVFISPIVYAVMHHQKPPIEFLLSGPTDVLFGSVDYHANSILPSVVAHGGGLILLDWLVLHEPLVGTDRVLEWLSWVPLPL